MSWVTHNSMDKHYKSGFEEKKQDSKESIQYDSIHKAQKQVKWNILFRDTILGSKTIKDKT